MPTRQSSARDGRPHPHLPARADHPAGPDLTSANDAVPGAIFRLDRDLRVIGLNGAAAVMLGRDRHELEGRSFEELLSVPARLLFQTHGYPALLADGRVEELLLTVSGDGPEPIPVLLNAERRDAPDGPTFVALVVPIRARSRWEQELLAATRALHEERAESRRLAGDLAAAARDLEERYAAEQRTRQFRDAFIGVVSHELRTPITTIFGMSHVLLRGHRTMDPEIVAARLADIEAEADRLRRLTEDLLVLSRAEGGRLEVAVEPLVLEHIVRALVDAEQQRTPGHRYELIVEPLLPLVEGESTFVEQALRNFLTNAAKYSPSGSRIVVKVAAREPGVAVVVTDEGAGFGETSPDQLWELFFRTEDAMRQTGGAGIGLYVARALVRAMGGDVWARERSGPGAGAEFGFWLNEASELDEE